MQITFSCIKNIYMQPANKYRFSQAIQPYLGAFLLLAVILCASSSAQARLPDRPEEIRSQDRYLSSLREGDQTASFRAAAIYLNGEKEIAGARFIHEPTRMPVDILFFDSVPQAMVWVETPPISDRGEPHASEHLVLGKGKKGKLFSLMLDMSMGSNSAATWRDKTLYHFYTAGGRQSFLELTYRLLDTLLHPDFTDEEIRREVAHLGVSLDEETGELSLEERGSVYLEMISSFEKPGTVIWSAIRRFIYGPGHPLGLESGGRPEAIRTMKPKHIREFFDHCYRPGESMGLIVGLPKSFGVRRFLSDLDGIFRKSFNGYIAQMASAGFVPEARKLPPWQPPGESNIHLLPYPAASETEPGAAVLSWPPLNDLTLSDRLRLETMWKVLMDDQASYLHKDLVDGNSRLGPAGITSVSGWINKTADNPAMVWLNALPVSVLNTDSLAAIRAIPIDRLAWLASLEPGSAELAEFNEKIDTHLISEERDLRQTLETPPGFGYRGTGDFWYLHLTDLAGEGGFERSLMIPRFREELLAELDQGNPWAALIQRLGLCSAPVTLVASYPDADLPNAQQVAKQERLDTALLQLKARFGTTDDQEAIRQYKEQFDLDTADLETLEKEIPRPGFLSDPPLTLDEMIDTELDSIAVTGETAGQAGKRKVFPLCINRFQRISLVETGLFYDITDITPEQLIYLPLLPPLISGLGCSVDGTWLPYDQLHERLQREINDFDVEYSSFPEVRGGRVELAIYASGLGAEETRTAVAWTGKLLRSSTRIGPEQLQRLRDLVSREIARLGQLPYGAEENWATNPARAYRYQRDAVYLSATSIFTGLHHLNRLTWRLETPPSMSELTALEAALRRALARGGNSREQIFGELTALDSNGSSLVRKAAFYLRSELEGGPQELARDDFSRLIGQLLSDLTSDPEELLDELNGLMQALLATGPSRALITGSKSNIEMIRPPLSAMVRELTIAGETDFTTPSHIEEQEIATETQIRSETGTLVSNLRSRYPWLEESEYRGGNAPAYAAMVLESSRNALFTNSTPMVAYNNLQYPDKISYLAAKVFSGAGSHGLFMKTWAAGLAYSNGMGANPRNGQVSYYAERCSDGVATLRYVTGLLEKAPETLDGTFFLDYALANSFSDYRGAGTYIGRGRRMASDLADGITEERVRKFKRSLLRLRERWQRVPEPNAAQLEFRTRGQADILASILEELPRVAGPVLPGYGEPAASSTGTVNFMIAPDFQIEAFEEYLRTQEPEARMVRIYPRDFWID